MDLFKMENWCGRAVRLIRYPPDRDAVYTELYQHMEDRYESFIAQGLPDKEARDKAVEAMGDPDAIATQLSRLHRPFWGYFCQITQRLLIVISVITLFTLLYFTYDDIRYYDKPEDTLYDGQVHEFYGDKVFYAEPGQTVRLDGYKITVVKVVRWENGKGALDPDNIYFRLRITKPILWADCPDMFDWFQAVDSLGNAYRCSAETDLSQPHVDIYQKSEDLFGLTLDMGLSDCVSRDAQWVELHYDRDGRSFVLRIDLTGGDAA